MSTQIHTQGRFSTPLAGFCPWPEEFAARYRAAGYWRGESLGSMLRHSAQQFPDNIAIVCGTRRWTYAELDKRADQLAAGLAAQGIGARDRVLLQLPNVAEFFAICFALFRLGAIPVFALAAHRRSEIVYFCQHAQASAYIIAAQDGGFDFRQLAREVRQSHPHLPVIVLGDSVQAEEFIALDGLYQQHAPEQAAEQAEPAASEVALMQLSGGSTGLPKLIARTHDDYLYSVRASAEICALSQDSVYLCALPVAHNFPLSSPGSLGVLYSGGKVVLANNASPDTAFALIAQEAVTITALVPPLAMIWLEAARSRRAQLASLQVLQVGGARLSDEIASRVRQEMGCQLQQVFGMAEGLVNYTRLGDSEEICSSSQGRPISPLDEVLIVDDEDQAVAPGEVGHLLTRGPYTIRGYYLAPEHNARAFTGDGFYRTGDLVQQLPGGYLIVQGRAKDQINRGGEKLAAEEVENHLLAHPQVHAAALVAMPDPFLGERSCAFIIAKPLQENEPLLRATLLTRFLRERGLAQYKIPDRIEFVNEFPFTGVGKVNKRVLRERIAAQITALAQDHIESKELA